MLKLRLEWRGVKEGAEFIRLTVLGPQFRAGVRWYCVCRCKCGIVIVTQPELLSAGTSGSCGCLRREIAAKNGRNNLRHGESKTPLHNVWWGMMRRCYDKNTADYKNYGGRGITVCAEWIDDFPAFREWALSHGYKPGLEIDREKNHMGYSPENCRFVTRKVNMRNRRNTRKETWQGETKTLAEWAEDPRSVVDYGSLLLRLHRGWAFKRALTEEPRKRRRNSR